MFAIDQPYAFVLIASVIVSIGMAVEVLMHKQTLGVHVFAALEASMGMWALTSLFEVCSPDLPTKVFCYSFKYLFIVMVPPAWFLFGLYYSNRLRRLQWRYIGLLGIMPALTLIAVATNRYHQEMFASLEFINTSAYIFLFRKFGSWFWIHTVYSYSLLFVGFLVMAKQLIDSPSPYRGQVITLLIGGLVPWIANMAFTFNLTPYPYLDLTPFAFAISSLAFMWGILRFQLLDVAPIAHEVVIRNIEDAILVVDGEQRIVHLNPAAQKMIDLTSANPIGIRAELIFSWWPGLRFNNHVSIASENRIVDFSKNGQRCLMRLKKVPVFCSHRKMGMLISLADATDAILAKEALLNSERRFRSLSENAPIIIFTLDNHGNISYLNPAWEKILGHKREELMSKPFIDLVANKKEWSRANLIELLIAGRKAVVELNITMYHKMGHSRLFNTSLAANSDTEGRVTGVIGLAKDITEERKLEQQLFQSQKMEAIGTLAGGVAHDFNNLLMGMQANLSLMRLDEGLTDAWDEKILRIENQIQSGASLTRQLLGYARKGQYVISEVNLKSLIKETLHVVQRTNKNISVQSLLSDEAALTKADRSQIEMVLLNLFLNAIDAMPNGGRLTVSCRTVSHQRDAEIPLKAAFKQPLVEIVVSDTGIGMDQATQERIFEPFFTTKEVGRGSGLGLASVYGVVHNHDGHIHVESMPGQGTTFTLYFPATSETVQKPRVMEKAVHIGGGTILLVEDEPLIQKYCLEMLKSLDFEVMTASCGQEAVQIYQEHCTDIDIVILDMIMPGMDGFAVFRTLNEINPRAKVIITSGFTMDQRIEEMISDGLHGYLKKPYTLEELSREIAKIHCRQPA